MPELSKKHFKKIAILLPSLPVGGAERLVFEELSYLKNDPRFYFEIHLVFEPGYLFDKFKELGMPVRVWNSPHTALSTIFTCLKIIFYLRQNRFDILHIHLLGKFGPWLGVFAGLKTFQTIHYEIKNRMMMRICLRRNDILFGCGVRVTNNLKNFIPAHMIRLLNNTINPLQTTVLSSEDVLLRMGLRKGNKIVLSLGRLTRQKGYDLLIESFRIVVEKQPEAVLLIGGDGPDMEKLKRQIVENGMQEHIRLLGIVSNVNDLLRICDVYVNSSRWEGLPMTILEAMANKKPIVATNVGGNSEAIKDRETGLLVPPERTDLLAESILTVLNDEELQNKLGSQAFELFEKNYSIKKHCEILANEYLA